MGSKAVLLIGLSLAVFLIIASEVSARELSGKTTASLTTSEAEEHKHVDEYGGPGGYGRGGYGGGGRGGYDDWGRGGYGGGYGGGRGGGYCRYGCCGRVGYHGGCQRCCAHKGEAIDAAAAAKP
ncbi:unnamed protein product [Cuscuta epithymum]|uniref:Glycine-rich protein n=1 Tax=Cuscuta epithymum TaxID=186058 RepID=A0AAV0BUC3_9ASTE|nr:unnamed protein product [Cuscuta epithymum]